MRFIGNDLIGIADRCNSFIVRSPLISRSTRRLFLFLFFNTANLYFNKEIV